MRILVFGAGVLGCNLANDFFRAGKDITLLARGEWGKRLKSDGLRIKSKFSPFTKVSRIPIITSLSPDDLYDVIFIAARYTQIPEITGILSQNRSENLIFVGNNVSTKKLVDSLHGKNVMFAFSSSAGHREADRVCSVDLRKITIGEPSGGNKNEAFIKKLFESTKLKVTYEPYMEDYLLCHAAFVLPAAFACYRTDGDLRKIKSDKEYIDSIIDANIEGYRAIEKLGYKILPEADKNYLSDAYRNTCRKFFRLICATSLGKICVSDHAMNAVDEMSALNRDIKSILFTSPDEYPVWQKLEKDSENYLQK